MPDLIIGIGGKPKKAPSMPPPAMGKGLKGAPFMDKAPAAAEPDTDESTEKAIPQEAVCFRSAAETCGQCEYNQSGQCSKLEIPVQDGDGCNLFEDKNEGGEQEQGETYGEEDDLGKGSPSGMTA